MPLAEPPDGSKNQVHEATKLKTQENAVDPALKSELEEIDRRVSQVHDVVSDFEEQKYASLLKKPLVSRGIMRNVGSLSRWDTTSPKPVSMVVDTAGIRIYYPQRSTLEIYQLEEKFKWLAVSPMPRLSTLIEVFTIERLSSEELGTTENAVVNLGLRLRPRDEAISKSIRFVNVVLNASTAFIHRAEIVDTDGDRTVILFSNVQANTGIHEKDLELVVPEGTQIVHPLAGLQQEAPKKSP